MRIKSKYHTHTALLYKLHTVAIDGWGPVGIKSMHGAVGGYVAKDIGKSKSIKTWLYSSHTQYPSMLEELALWCLVNGFKLCRVICDNHPVLVGAAAQTVASEYKFIIDPISPYTTRRWFSC